MPEILLSAAPYLAIVVFLILTGVGLPIPEEAFVISAGVASSVGHLDPWLALACCLIGALAGDSLVYAIGFRFGRRVLLDRPWCARFLPPERERRIEHLILRHGLKMFLATRFLIGLRSPIYLTAGILRVPYRRFLIADAFSAALVVGLFFGLGYHFGEPIGRWIRGGQWGLTIVAVAAMLCAACVLWWRRRKSRAHGRIAVELAARSVARLAATRRPIPNPPDASEQQRRPAAPQLERDPQPDPEKPTLR
jgi:membrane protein DedA with SNARE-associated domain